MRINSRETRQGRIITSTADQVIVGRVFGGQVPIFYEPRWWETSNNPPQGDSHGEVSKA